MKSILGSKDKPVSQKEKRVWHLIEGTLALILIIIVIYAQIQGYYNQCNCADICNELIRNMTQPQIYQNLTELIKVI